MPKFRNKTTGQIVEAPDLETARKLFATQPDKTVDAPPTQTQEEAKPGLWDKLNAPLWEGPSRLGRSISEGMRPTESLENPISAFKRGAIEGVGDMVSSFTSPLSLGLTAASLGSGIAAQSAAKGSVGALRAARALSNIERAGGLGMMAHGGYKVVAGENLGERLGGALEVAGGGLARHHAGTIRGAAEPKIASIPRATPPEPATIKGTRYPSVADEAESALAEKIKTGGGFSPAETILEPGDLSTYQPGKDLKVTVKGSKTPKAAKTSKAPSPASQETLDALKKLGLTDDKLAGLTDGKAKMLLKLVKGKAATPPAQPISQVGDDLTAQLQAGERAVASPRPTQPPETPRPVVAPSRPTQVPTETGLPSGEDIRAALIEQKAKRNAVAPERDPQVQENARLAIARQLEENRRRIDAQNQPPESQAASLPRIGRSWTSPRSVEPPTQPPIQGDEYLNLDEGPDYVGYPPLNPPKNVELPTDVDTIAAQLEARGYPPARMVVPPQRDASIIPPRNPDIRFAKPSGPNAYPPTEPPPVDKPPTMPPPVDKPPTVQPTNDINAQFNEANEAFAPPPDVEKPPTTPDVPVDPSGRKLSRLPFSNIGQLIKNIPQTGDIEFDNAVQNLKVMRAKAAQRGLSDNELQQYQTLAGMVKNHPRLPDEFKMRWAEIAEKNKKNGPKFKPGDKVLIRQPHEPGPEERPRLVKNPRQGIGSETGAVGPGVGQLAQSQGQPMKGGKTPKTSTGGKLHPISKSVNPEFDASYQDWVNARHAGNVESKLASRDFTDLDSEGMDIIHRFQKGDRSGRLKDVADYFSRKHREMTDAGVNVNWKTNYIRQIWSKDSQDAFREAARRLGLKPSLSMKSIFDSYEAGEAHGLKPKTTKISEIVSLYERMANKAIADRKFFDFLTDNGYLRPVGKAPRNWQQVTNFPIKRFLKKLPNGKWVDRGSTAYSAPPEVAATLNNYLNQPDPVLKWIADKSSITKNIALSSGVPFTGINAHGFNITFRNMMAKGAKGLGQGVAYMLNPKMAATYLDKNLDKAPFFVRHGLTLSSEEHAFGEVGSTGLAKYGQGFLKLQGKLFEDPLFQKIIPALKLEHVQSVFEQLRTSGLAEREAAKKASQITNSFFGGINWEEMQRSRSVQNFYRTLFLAPDWLETTFRTGSGIARSVASPTNPTHEAYRTGVRNLVAAYFAANLLNKQQSGHWMWQNDPGHGFDVELGTAKGPNGKQKKRYLRMGGTAADFARLPIDVVQSASKGENLGQAFQIAKNRMSIPAVTGMNLFSNKDSQGREIYGKDKYGRWIPPGQQAINIGREVARPSTPQYIKGPMDAALGRIGWEEAAAGASESPLRYAAMSSAPNARRRSRPRLGVSRR